MKNENDIHVNQLLNNEDNLKNVKKKKNKATIISVTAMSMIILGSIIFLIVFLLGKYGSSNNISKQRVEKTKTVMIYMCGSDLESSEKLATYNIKDLIDSNVDYDNIRIFLCAGGSSRWFNSDISVQETSIFEINENGLNKVKKQKRVDMADSNTVTEFLDYAYENSQTDEYYFMFWNHGLAISGLEYDELSNNILSLSDLDNSFKNSKINKDDKKIDMVILNNCLMGSLETASVLSKYSNYLVASEDVMYGSSEVTPFKFLDGMTSTNTVEEIGKSFIDCYSNSMKENLSNVYITFSMIDLNKINTVMDNLGEYFGNIEINTTSFKNIAKIRSSNVYEYQKAIDEYDMVDLYQLVTKLEPVNGDNKKLLDSIKEAVKYNSATDSYSNGISIYFPETVDWRKVYNTINFSSQYKKFLNEYIEIYTAKSAVKYALNTKEVQKNNNNGFSLQLSDEEASTYKNGSFMVLEDNKDGTYTTVIKSSSDVNIDSKGVVTANIGKVIKIVDKDGTEFGVGNLILLDKKDTYSLYGLPVILYNDTKTDSALMTLRVGNDGKIEVLETHKWSKDVNGNVVANGAIIDFNNTEYKRISIIKNVKTIKTDENGNYEGIDEMKSSYGYEWNISDFFNDTSFKQTELDKDKKYVGVFNITDVYNDSHYSKLIDIN